jgi:hypothetical protein
MLKARTEGSGKAKGRQTRTTAEYNGCAVVKPNSIVDVEFRSYGRCRAAECIVPEPQPDSDFVQPIQQGRELMPIQFAPVEKAFPQ